MSIGLNGETNGGRMAGGLFFRGAGAGRTGSSHWRCAWAALLIPALLLLAGCHSDHDKDHSRSVFVTQIFSDPAADGDIARSPAATYTITSALNTGSVLAGIDSNSGDEFRGFLDFPLRGPKGVPAGAAIESATLEIFISSLVIPAPDRTLPVLMDLVTFQPPALISSDFDRAAQPPLLTLPFDFISSDDGTFVTIDVTALMDEAQIEGLDDLQLRFLLDFIAAAGLVEIDDSAADTAPLLTVTYYFN